MLQIVLFYFCVAHVVFKFDYRVHADLELDLGSRSGLGLSLGCEVSGLGLVGKGLGLGGQVLFSWVRSR